MKSGFIIAIFGESFVETYVFNAGNSQLIYTKIRSGDDRLPNPDYSRHGVKEVVSVD